MEVYMSQEVIGHCPICNHQLVATKLSCNHCGLELSNEFSLSKFSYLSAKDLHFVEMFLRCRGNFKELQTTLNISYPTATKQLDSILGQLGYQPVIKDTKQNVEVILSALPIYDDESKTVQAIKKKLNSHKGKATLSLTRGKHFEIYYESFGNGIIATNLPSGHVLTWKAFDTAVELLQNNHRRAKKGQAMKGKLGDKELTLDTVEGYVAYHAYDIPIGSSVLRTITPLAAILDWSGVCNNCYGYLELKSSFTNNIK